VAQVNADQARELPQGFFACGQALVVDDGDADDGEVGYRGLQRCEGLFVGFVHFGDSEHRWQVNPCERYFVAYVLQRGSGCANILAIDNGIGTAQDAEEGATSATVLIGTCNEPWNLDELDGYPADACQGGDRA
jgi:hypothetical protein